MRKPFLAAVASTILLTTAACGGQEAEDGAGDAGSASECSESFTIRIGHQVAPDAPLNQGAERFGELVDERSDGRVTVQVFPSAQLGTEDQLLEQNASGALEISLAGPPALSNFDANAAMFIMPYSLAGDTEQEQYDNLKSVVETEVVQELTEQIASEQQFRPVDWTWWYGNRHVTNSVRPITEPADMEGLQLRTPDAAVHFLALQALGAATTPVAFGELYLALELGTVDGQENPINIIEAQQFAEVQDHLSLTGHMSMAMAPVVSESWWQGLCEGDRQMIDEALEEAGEYQSELAIQGNEEGVDRLREAGMQVETPDLAPFREATEGAVDRWAAENPGFNMEWYDTFIDAQTSQ